MSSGISWNYQLLHPAKIVNKKLSHISEEHGRAQSHPQRFKGYLAGSVVKNPSANAGDTGSIPGSGRSPEGGHGNPLQYSCLENPMDRGTWWVHWVTKSRTQLERLSMPICCIADIFFTTEPPGKPHIYSTSMFNIYRNCQAVLQTGCSILHSHQKWMCEGSNFCTSSPTLVIFRCFLQCFAIGGKWYWFEFLYD